MPSPREYLLARLWGPMASWGTIAVGEQRQTWTRPSRSGVLGLIAAALGIERSQPAAHDALERALGLAVRVDAHGRPLRDYHTTQSPQQEAKRRWASRYDEIRNARKLNTILSERHYVTEASAAIALWLRPGHVEPVLASIVHRLRHPAFTLYLGRKASPIGLPPRPFLCTATSLKEAFLAFDGAERAWLAKTDPKWRWLFPDLTPGSGAVPSAWLSRDDADPADGRDSGLGPLRIAEHTARRDAIRDRHMWTFDDREEVRVLLDGDNTP